MLRLLEKVFLYLLRAAGVFLLHISGFMDFKDELKSYLPIATLREALDYARYLPHFYIFAMVRINEGNYLSKNDFLILFPLQGDCSSGDSKAQVCWTLPQDPLWSSSVPGGVLSSLFHWRSIENLQSNLAAVGWRLGLRLHEEKGQF